MCVGHVRFESRVDAQPTKKPGSQPDESKSSSETETYATRCTLPIFASALATSTLALPLPSSKPCRSNPTEPTHETKASGLPTAASRSPIEPRTRSFATHDTDFDQPSETAQAGGAPDLERATTSAPPSTRYLHTREPTKPDPPATVTFSADAAAAHRSSPNRLASIADGRGEEAHQHTTLPRSESNLSHTIKLCNGDKLGRSQGLEADETTKPHSPPRRPGRASTSDLTV